MTLVIELFPEGCRKIRPERKAGPEDILRFCIDMAAIEYLHSRHRRS